VDVQEFERLYAAALAAPPEQRAADLEQALALDRGDLLPDDRYEELNAQFGPGAHVVHHVFTAKHADQFAGLHHRYLGHVGAIHGA
jgi:hypothetical protein